jgi:RNA polymerase sigma-70 factor (ECF subfamily)
MFEKEDSEIITRVNAGRVNDFRLIVDRYQQVIFGMAYKMTGNYEDAKEITQQTFVTVYSKLKLFDPGYKFFSWLYRIGINETLSYLKSKRDHLPVKEEYFIASEIQAARDNAREKEMLIRKAIKDLKDDFRILIVLKYYENFSYEEISALTGVPVKKVRSRLFTARQILKNNLTNLL